MTDSEKTRPQTEGPVWSPGALGWSSVEHGSRLPPARRWRAMDAIAGMPERRPLAAGAVAVLAPGPAAGPALAILQLLLGPANATFSGRLLLGILDPADELVARQGCDVLPSIECGGVGDQRLAQVCG